jgi:hypothetical protein
MKTTVKTLATLFAVILMGPLMISAQNIIETRETPPFTGINVSGAFSVILTQGDAFLVEVEAPQSQISDISIGVSRNTLIINYEGRSRNLEKMTIYATAPVFEKLNSSGASSITGENLLTSPALTVDGSGASNFSLQVDTDLLTTNLSGASRAIYSGKATRHELNASGASIVRAYDLETESTASVLSGASNANVTATARLTAATSGTSKLSYRGDPLTTDIRSSGLSSVSGRNGTSDSQTRVEKDTFIVSLGKQEVRVAEGGTVSVRPRRTYHHFRDNWTGLELGINGYLSPGNNLTLEPGAEFMDVRYNRSVAVNLNLWQQNLVIVRSSFALVTGVGFGWNNYYFNNDILLQKGSEGVGYEESDQNFKRSKLTVSHLNVPLLLELQSPVNYGPNAFHLSAGINVGLRLRSHTKQVYFIDGDKQKDKLFEDFHMSPFRYDATARIGWGRINLFASYALNAMFKDGKGPELTPFTLGIRVISF